MSAAGHETRRTVWLAILLVLASVILRSRHLDWGLPDLEEEALPLKKAFEMCGWGTGQVTLDPETAGWPSLSFYVHMLVQAVHYGVGRLAGLFANGQDYFLQQISWTPIAIWARAVGVGCAAVIVFVGTRLAARLAGFGGALLAGLVLLVSPLLTTHSQLITPDILLAMLAALATSRLISVYESGRMRDYVWAGVWIGLGASAKYTPVLLIPALYVAHLMGRRSEGATLRRLALDDRRLWWALGACAMAFVATSPYLLADLSVVARDMDYQVAHLQGGHFGHASQRPGLVYYGLDVLAPGLGWPAFLLGLSGLVAAAWRRRGSWLVVLVALVVFYVALALLKTRFDRYMLPALLPLALGVAGWWALLRPRLADRSRLAAGGILAITVLAAAIPPALATGHFLALQGRPSTQELARDWILKKTAGADPYLAMELYTPLLPRARQLRLRQADPALPKLSPEQRRRWLDIDPVHAVFLPFYTTRQGASDFYYDLRHYLGYDYVVTSSAVRGRYEQDPVRYAKQIAFYRDLERVAPPTRVFAPEGRHRGPEIRIHALAPGVRAQLRSERSLMTSSEIRQASRGVATLHFQDFVKTVAEHATARDELAIAATYYEPLYATMPAGEREQYLPAYAHALVRAQWWDQAMPLLAQWKELAPADPRPVAYTGLGLIEQGALEAARAELLACLEITGESPRFADLTNWVRSLLVRVDD